MSTMYDALRKAEAERKKAAGIVENNSESGNPVSGGGMNENTKTVVLLIAVLLVFGFAFFRIKGLMGVAEKPVVKAAIVPQASVPVVLPVQPPKAPYTLDGVIDAGDNSMAIVNGKLLKYDDRIDDLILKKISPKEVEMLNIKDNSTVVLKIN